MDPVTLYQLYYPVIYQQVRSHVRQHEQAEDLTQDTFVKALGALDHAPEVPEELRRWLGHIARNTLIDHVRHARLIAWSRLDEESAIATGDLSETIALRLEVRAVLRMLPAYARQVLLASAEGYTIAEMATLLGVAPDVAKMRYYRARQEFKRRYLARQAKETWETQDDEAVI